MTSPAPCILRVFVMALCDKTFPEMLQHRCYNGTGELQVPGLWLPDKKEKAEAHLCALVGCEQDKQQISKRKNKNARSWIRRHGEFRPPSYKDRRMQGPTNTCTNIRCWSFCLYFISDLTKKNFLGFSNLNSLRTTENAEVLQ